MIDTTLFPCIVKIPDSDDLYTIDDVDTSYSDYRYYYDGTWVCNESDNPQLIFTFEELRTYFPERMI